MSPILGSSDDVIPTKQGFRYAPLPACNITSLSGFYNPIVQNLKTYELKNLKK